MDDELMELSPNTKDESALREGEETSNPILDLSMEAEEEEDNEHQKEEEKDNEEEEDNDDKEEEEEKEDEEEDKEEGDEEEKDDQEENGEDNEEDESEESGSEDSSEAEAKKPEEVVAKKVLFSERSIQEKANDVREKLIMTGQIERLHEFVDVRLSECGWKADIQNILRAEIKKHGTFTFEELYEIAKERGKMLIPDTVENECLEKMNECYEANLPDFEAFTSDDDDETSIASLAS